MVGLPPGLGRSRMWIIKQKVAKSTGTKDGYNQNGFERIVVL